MQVEFNEVAKWHFRHDTPMLVKAMKRFYADPENMKAFKEWCQTPMGKSFEGEPEYAD